MRVLFKRYLVPAIGESERHLECVRFRDFLFRFPIGATVHETERLARAVRSLCFQAQWACAVGSRLRGKCQPKSRRRALLEDGQLDGTLSGRNFPALAFVFG